MCGQHPGMTSRVGVVIFMSLVFYMFQSILNISWFFPFFWLEKLIIFMDGGYPPPPIRENSPENNLIFEPFPYFLVKKTIAAPILLSNQFDYFSHIGKCSGY